MEEDGEGTPRTPFWIQSTTHVRRVELYRRRASSLFFNSGVLITLLLLFALLSIILFIIPSLISSTSHKFRPILDKKSWDSINLVLVLFALACGFLGSNINNDQKSRLDSRTRSDLSTGDRVESPSGRTPHQWYEQPMGGLRRHRSSSSYPDLRELSPPWNNRAVARWRFSDDTHLNGHRVSDYERYYFKREEDPDMKDVVVRVNTVMDISKEDSYAPPSHPHTLVEESCFPPSLPPQPPATTPGASEKPIGTYHNIAAEDGERSSLLPDAYPPVTALPAIEDPKRKGETGRGKRSKGERRRARSSEPRKVTSPINDPAPSPPSILPVSQDSEQKTSRLEGKRTGANATKEFFTSFYQKTRKKRHRQRSVDNLDGLLHRSRPPVKFQLPPPSPPPPPPPPPPSVLNNLFSSKKEKRKKILQATSSPPPAPPSTKARAPKATTTRGSDFIREKPVKMSYLNSMDESSSGGESPMSGIPPPPPMPPFRMRGWKFAVEGDYVRVNSPEGEESPSRSPVTCPSPDVDTKADNFIARFRAGLKLEKMNSFNLRMSNLGPKHT